jgi:hypothetical protein
MAGMDAPSTDQLVELRNYRLVAGGFDPFTDHFEQRFLASQESLGMDIVGQFRVAGHDDRFVWVRRYRDPRARADALARFYGGPVWAEHGPLANELMVDHTDVHLLAPDPSGPAFAADHVPHAQRAEGASSEPGSTLVAAIFEVDEAGRLDPALAAAMDRELDRRPEVAERGRLVTAGVPNDFPRLPVHERPVAAWLLSDTAGGRGAVAAGAEVAVRCGLPSRTLRLEPTPRSTLR